MKILGNCKNRQLCQSSAEINFVCVGHAEPVEAFGLALTHPSTGSG